MSECNAENCHWCGEKVTHVAQPSTGESDLQFEDQITEIVRKADEGFRKAGGSSRHWTRDWFLPLLEQSGFYIQKSPPAQPDETI